MSKHDKNQTPRKAVHIPERLSVLSELVSFGSFADIGCDHGLLTAHLLMSGKVCYAVASDIGKGPLDAARKNMALYGISDRVSLRLGPGISVLKPGEVESCVIAGMGGMNICGILNDSPDVLKSLSQLIVSPERDMEAVRRYLHGAGFFIMREILTRDKHHFYFALDARPGAEPPYSDIGYMFGQKLLDARDKTLLLYIKKEEARINKIGIPMEDYRKALKLAENSINI